ncbi:MAG: hypothetical protein ACUVRU_07680 [Anaerolineae bacterium]
MNRRLAETLTVDAGDLLVIDEGWVENIDRASDNQTDICADSDDSAGDCVVVVTLDDRSDNPDSGSGGWGSGGDDDDDAHLRAPQPEMSDERRDTAILMMISALAVGTMLLVGGIALTGALGWVQPACGGVLATRTVTCQGASQLYTTLRPAITPDWSRYRLDAPATDQQPAR